ncbi:MAG: LTA synthase family protein [Myxococcota bacterium]|nr:LTA synthase family protein [Myxococcota bacterium]
MSSTCLGLETLYFVAQNAWFLSDLGPSVTRVLVVYAAAWMGVTLLGTLVSRDTRIRFALTAAFFYFAFSIKLLGRDSSFLSQPWGLATFAATTLVLGALGWWLQKRTGSEFVWFAAVVGYQAGILGLAYSWATRGGNLLAFVRSPHCLLVLCSAACLTLLGGYLLVTRPQLRPALGFAAALLPFVASFGFSRRPSEGSASAGAPGGPDIYVFSVDALRKDTFDDWCLSGASDLTELVCRSAVRHEAVVTDGISTYQVLVRNLALQGDCSASLPGRLKGSHLTSMYLGRRGKRITGSGCFDRYFSGTGRVLAESFVMPNLLRRVPTGAEAGELREKYVPTDEMLARFAREEGRVAQPLFSYFHVLDMHGPYVPSSLAKDPQHLADVREFQQFCYWGHCDLEEPHNRGLVERMRAAYLSTLTDVEHHLRAFLKAARARKRPFVLVFTADHGELFGEHRAINHSGGFVQELLSIPFAVYDSRHPVRDVSECTLEFSSEALHEVIGMPRRANEEPTGRRTLTARPLGRATIDAQRGEIDYEIDPAMREFSGTWRNVHTSAMGRSPWRVPRCGR